MFKDGYDFYDMMFYHNKKELKILSEAFTKNIRQVV